MCSLYVDQKGHKALNLANVELLLLLIYFKSYNNKYKYNHIKNTILI